MMRRPGPWIVFGLLGVAGVVVAIRFFPAAFPIVTLDLAMDREAAVARADTLARQYGWDPADARTAATFGQTDPEVQSYVELEAGGRDAFVELAERGIHQPYIWTVRRFQEGAIEESQVRFTPAGVPYGFRLRLSEDDPGSGNLAEAEARAVADGTAAEWGVDLAPFELLESSQGNAARRTRGSHVRVRADGRYSGGGPLSASDPGGWGACLRACALRLRAGGLLPALPGHAFEERRDRVRIAVGFRRPLPACGRRRRHGLPHEEASDRLASGARLGRRHRRAARPRDPEHPAAELDGLRSRRLDPDVPGPATGPGGRHRRSRRSAPRVHLPRGGVAGTASVPRPPPAVALLVAAGGGVHARARPHGGRVPSSGNATRLRRALLPGHVAARGLVVSRRGRHPARSPGHRTALAGRGLDCALRRLLGGERVPRHSHRVRGPAGSALRPEGPLDLGCRRAAGRRLRRRSRQLPSAASLRPGGGAHGSRPDLGRDLPVLRSRADHPLPLHLQPLAALDSTLRVIRARHSPGPGGRGGGRAGSAPDCRGGAGEGRGAREGAGMGV